VPCATGEDFSNYSAAPIGPIVMATISNDKWHSTLNEIQDRFYALRKTCGSGEDLKIISRIYMPNPNFLAFIVSVISVLIRTDRSTDKRFFLPVSYFPTNLVYNLKYTLLFTLNNFRRYFSATIQIFKYIFNSNCV